MANDTERRDAPTDELRRVAEQIAERLQRRGVTVRPDDTAEDLATLFEAIEKFETAVEAQGGDLMMDEPPAGHRAEPDDPAFALPVRNSGESALAFASRVEAIGAELRR